MAAALDLQFYCRKWGLTDPILFCQTPVAELYCARKGAGAEPVFLKIYSALHLDECVSSAAALRSFNGRGAVRLLGSASDALLMPEVPGESLVRMVREGHDIQASTILADVVLELHSNACARPDGSVALDEIFKPLYQRRSLEESSSIYKRAGELIALLLTEGHPQLLHGDLHHGNIIGSAESGWCAIDPKGFWGNKYYEFAGAFFNPIELNELVLKKERIETMAEFFANKFALSPQKILQFAFCHGVLSAIWEQQDGGDPSHRLAISETIYDLFSVRSQS